jgi:hypothetical protein
MKRDKLISIVLVALVLLPIGVRAGLVNNTAAGTSANDSTGCLVKMADSLGNAVAADSFYVQIKRSGGIVFSAAGGPALAGLDSSVQGGRVTYLYNRLVADIDGDGDFGVYQGQVRAVNTTLGLDWSNEWEFQIVNYDLDDLGLTFDWLVAFDSSWLFPTTVLYDLWTYAKLAADTSRVSDVLRALIPSDTATGSILAELLSNAALAADTSLLVSAADFQTMLDTLGFLNGYGFGAFAKYSTNSDVDSLFVGNGVDTIAVIINYHAGGSPGDPPTNSVCVRWP